MRWNYTMARQDGNVRALEWYKSRGLQAMIATATNSQGGILFQTDEREKGNASSGITKIRSFIQLAAEKNISGELCTAWDDRAPHMENRWRGFIASGEYGWSPNGRSLEEFDQTWLQREFGLSIPDYYSFNQKLRKGSMLWYEAFFRNGNLLSDENGLQSVVQLEHWLKPLEGQEKRCFDYTSKLIDLPDLNSPGTWSLKYKDRLDKALAEINSFESTTERLLEIQNTSKRNSYYWSLSKALYNLQISAPRILLALKDCDTADKAKQKVGIENIKKTMRDFQKTWEDVKSVYSQTSFIANPPNYVPDRYFHLASQREDLSWMIQADEMYNGMIEIWLRNQKLD